MTRIASVSPLVAKEIRALLPLWLATLLALAAAILWRQRSYSDIGLIAYVAGVVSLGAHAIGHEYGHRTLPALLAQPIARWRLFATKILVAAAMAGVLAAAAAAVFAADSSPGNDTAAYVIMPILAALFLAPLFTLLCRNTLAGAVLGVSAPLMVWIAAILVAWWGFGTSGEAVTAWVLQRWVTLALIVCPMFAALTWRGFSRMEAVEGMPAALTLPRLPGMRTGTRRHAPWRALIAKEIHLQQMSIAITLFYAVIWAIGAGLRPSLPSSAILPLEALLLLYCMGLTIAIGAMASAEERQQGMLDAQLLQPVSALGQWAVKCAVTLSLALLLGVAMPAILISNFGDTRGAAVPNFAVVLLVLLITSSSLYLSSLTGSGVKAMALSLPVAVGGAIFIQTTQSAVVSASTWLGTPLPADHTEAFFVASLLLPVLVVPLLLWFGFVNHHSTEHPLRRTTSQICVVAITLVAVIAAAGAII
jgi:ABC-type transport system involved in multi-copper enzyme maturation permease subunit